jgi:hypothetical protein
MISSRGKSLGGSLLTSVLDQNGDGKLDSICLPISGKEKRWIRALLGGGSFRKKIIPFK